MKFIGRVILRILRFSLFALISWFIVTQIFQRLDEQLPLLVALLLTYFISAYGLLPPLIHFGIMILRRGRIPRVAHTHDGLIADPVNVLLTGTAEELTLAFKTAGWYQADPLSIRSGLKMIRCFIFNKPYEEAPFSPLYLFGRVQDYGFQQPIGISPRARHHIRFWAANINPEVELFDVRYWLKKHSVDTSQPLTWVGTASKDIGLGLTELTYKISHRIDHEVDTERDYIIELLNRVSVVENANFVDAGQLVSGKYVTDGKIWSAKLRS